MIRGSCLCSAVRYEVSVPFEEMHHCHCSRCRKAHGAAFSTFGRVPATALTVTSGADLIRRYRSSAQVERAFCATCGSNLRRVPAAGRVTREDLPYFAASPFFITSTSTVIASSSPTSTPPPSRVLLKTMPKS